MHKETMILNAAAMQRALTRIAHEIAERNENSAEVVLVGIHRGGVPLANRLAGILSGIWSQPVPVGSMDVGMHRDDLDRRAAPTIQPTVIPFDVTGKTVVLVDDVLFSGRTTRAAMDALNDFGRPKRIQLAVLIDRGHRELPIKADFVGKERAHRPERANQRPIPRGRRHRRGDPAAGGRNMSWNRKHLLDIESLTAEEIVTVLDTARAFKAVGERAIKKVPALRGKTVVNLFVEPSTRTRISFELAEQRLSADIINFTAEASSLKKGETLKDTARNLEALNADFIVIRHSASGRAAFSVARVLRRQRHQRRRRRARASHPGAARRLHHSREKGEDRRTERDDSGRHSLQPRGALEHLGADQAGRARSPCAARPRWCPKCSSRWAAA